MQKNNIKAHVQELISKHSSKAVDLARDILEHPETGFREFRTAGLVHQFFDSLGLSHQDGLAITGTRADLIGAKQGPTVAIMGELDSLIVPGHPFADPNTEFAHACGHHTQIGSMLAAAAALADPDIREYLNGNIAFIAVPAEEYIELEFRNDLKKEGIDYKVGKFSFMGNGRAKTAFCSEGFVKIVVESNSDKILGAHIIGPMAGDLIHEICVAMEFGASAEDLARTCHAHPTYSEAVKEAALACGFGAIHA